MTRAGSASSRRVLIVEDDETRCQWFRSRLQDRVLDVTCDVAQATEWLAERRYDLILLDHDLTLEHYFSNERDDERTGYAVAAWLAAHPESQPGSQVVVHSLNYEGASRMCALLTQAGYDAEHIPFPYLQSGLRF